MPDNGGNITGENQARRPSNASASTGVTSVSGRKRAPFTEASRDMFNRPTKSKATSAAASSSSSSSKARPSSLASKSKTERLESGSASSSGGGGEQIRGKGMPTRSVTATSFRGAPTNAALRAAGRKRSGTVQSSRGANLPKADPIAVGERRAASNKSPKKEALVKAATERLHVRRESPSSNEDAGADGERCERRRGLSHDNTDAADGDGESHENRARLYKAEAYEAKVRVAAQEQRIHSLRAELEEVRFFHDVERENGRRRGSSGGKKVEGRQSDTPPRAKLPERPISRGGENPVTPGSNAPVASSTADAEWIVALERSLENTRQELAAAQEEVSQLTKSRVEEIQAKVVEVRKKTISECTEYVESTLRAKWEMKEISYKKALEQKTKDLVKLRADSDEGLSIMKDLEAALNTARSEREETKSKLESAVTEKETITAALEQYHIGGGKYGELERSHQELQKVLKVVQSQSEKKMEKMKQTLKNAHKREENLEEEHRTLVEKYEENLEGTREMESALSGLADKYEALAKERGNLAESIETNEQTHKRALSDFRDEYQEQLRNKEDLLRKLEVSKLERMRQEHAIVMDKLKNDHAAAMEGIKKRHATELNVKDGVLKCQESLWESTKSKLTFELDQKTSEVTDMTEELAGNQSKTKAFAALDTNYQSEIKSLKARAAELEGSISTGNTDLVEQVIALKREKEGLLLKTQDSKSEEKAVEAARKDYDARVERKEKEVRDLTSRLAAAKNEKKSGVGRSASPAQHGGDAADLTATNKNLKQDLLVAVESSISRAKTIQELEKSLADTQTKLHRSNQKIKRKDKTATAASASVAFTSEEKERFKSEISTLRTNMLAAENTISTLRRDFLKRSRELPEKSLQQSFKDELAKEQEERATKEAEMQVKMTSLAQALQATEQALQAVSSRKNWQATATDDSSHINFESNGTSSSQLSLEGQRDRIRQIEDDGLNAYYANRMQQLRHQNVE